MDLLEILTKDHDGLRRGLERIAAEVGQDRDARGLPSGWKVRNEQALVDGLKLLLPALAAHEAIEEKLLFAALREAGEDEPVLELLGGDHRSLEVLVRSLASVLTGERDKPVAWLVSSTIRLVDSLRAHMKREEYEVFPMVRDCLSKKRLKTLGEKAQALLHPVC